MKMMPKTAPSKNWKSKSKSFWGSTGDAQVENTARELALERQEIAGIAAYEYIHWRVYKKNILSLS